MTSKKDNFKVYPKQNVTFWVTVSRSCALNLQDLLTITQNVTFYYEHTDTGGQPDRILELVDCCCCCCHAYFWCCCYHLEPDSGQTEWLLNWIQYRSIFYQYFFSRFYCFFKLSCFFIFLSFFIISFWFVIFKKGVEMDVNLLTSI